MRVPVGEASTDTFAEDVRRALRRVYGMPRPRVEAVDLPLQRLRDMFVIETVRRQMHPLEVPAQDDLDAMHAAVMKAVRSFVRPSNRTPRRPRTRSEGPSVASGS